MPADAETHGGHEGHSATTVRTATHNGHEIRVETTYTVTIDGEPLPGGLEVLDNGSVHYHGLPQYTMASALDMVRRVVDYFGTERPAVDELGGDGHGHDHAGHDHGDGQQEATR